MLGHDAHGLTGPDAAGNPDAVSNTAVQQVGGAVLVVDEELTGQILAGDAEGAMRGLQKILLYKSTNAITRH